MWFKGSVQEAIALSKKENKVFMVYIEGDDENSQKMNEFYDNSIQDDITKILKNEVVSIRLKHQSPDYKNFSAFYPVVVVPCTFFIGSNGIPLEIAGFPMTNEGFIEKVTKALRLHKAIPKNEINATVNENSQVPQMSAPMTEKPSGDQVEPSAVNVENKVERAQELLEAIRAKKLKDENERLQKEEKERIRTGKEMAKSKQLREELEMAELMKSRAKDKRDEKIARERVLAQIAADREERKQRSMMTAPIPKAESPASTSKTSSPSSSNSKVARIQFRLPNNSPLTHEFSSDEQLGALRDFVRSNSSWKQFSLSTTFPRKTFNGQDYSSTLIELGLTPSAVLIVCPERKKAGPGPLVQSGWFTMIWEILVYPVVMVWTFIRSMFFGPPSGGESASNSSPRTDQKETRKGDNRAQSASNPDGNVARLRTLKKSDEDDDKTYNGNSTQQM